jgi:hypothetical protein
VAHLRRRELTLEFMNMIVLSMNDFWRKDIIEYMGAVVELKRLKP